MNKTNNTYCLSQLEVYNWGPFNSLHRMEFNPAGCALIGQTGSGKTTLVDAIMTLICPQPKYNLASTGGHESDRDLMSYVRGVTGIGGDDESMHIARAEQTITGISAEFSLLKASDTSTTETSTIRLSALLWIDSSSSSQSDMKRLWIFDQTNNHHDKQQGLSDYLQQLKEHGIRGLNQQLKEQDNIVATNNKKTYLAHCRRFFEVGENAFVLLNRAAGLKQLNSIDDLFRELVLDDRAAFKRAAEVCNEFDELNAIHSELQLAREQQHSLIPIEETYRKQQARKNKFNALNEQLKNLPLWYAHHSKKLWQQHADQQHIEIQHCQSRITQHEQQHKNQQRIADEYYQLYQKLGGNNIEEIKRQLEERNTQLTQIKLNVRDYQQLCQSLKLDAELNEQSLQKNKQQANQLSRSLENELTKLDSQREQQTQSTLNTEDKLREINNETRQVEATPDSNIPNDFLIFQQALAKHLNIEVDAIPYIGQCIEVQDKNWQGAIERAIGSHRLRLVIDAEHMQSTLSWINQRNNRLHVRLLNTADYQQKPRSLIDGFCEKLNFKSGAHKQVVQNFIAGIDRHCVDSAETLRDTPYGLTREGLMSGKRGLFEKQDQRSINQGWITGFDNRSRLAELKQLLSETQKQASAFRQQLEKTKKQQQQFLQQLDLLKNLQQLDFNALDSDYFSAQIQQLQTQLDALQNPLSDTAKAEQQWQTARQQLADIQNQINAQQVELKISENEKHQAEKQIANAALRLKEPLSQQQLLGMEKTVPIPSSDQRENLPALELEATNALQEKITRQQKQLADLQNRLGKLMVSAKQKDNGALSEVGSEREDIPQYLERLQLLTKEALPEKLQRFLDYLNQSSDQGVTQLLTRIDNEVSVIEERIDELNETLYEVDFQAGAYLKLLPQKVSHESLQSLQKAQRDLRSAAMQDDQGEAHFNALMEIIKQLRDAVERKRTRPALALLDPRYRLQFSVAIIERETQRVIETRTGSKGGSGGEKEIIASFILTASLSYALCARGRTQPLFSTVILDEAFSKSSQAVAARIISALKQFGLHPLFVTPNKEMRLLRNHTQSAVLVHRKGQQSTVLSLSWKEIDDYVLQRTENKRFPHPNPLP